jgi:hypothetical protein
MPRDKYCVFCISHISLVHNFIFLKFLGNAHVHIVDFLVKAEIRGTREIAIAGQQLHKHPTIQELSLSNVPRNNGGIGSSIFYAIRPQRQGYLKIPSLPQYCTVYIYIRCPSGIWNSSCSVRGRYLYLRDKGTRMSCSLQTATRPQYSEFVVCALEHKDQWRENSRDLFLQKSLTTYCNYTEKTFPL